MATNRRPQAHVHGVWITVERRKRVPATTGVGFTTVPDGKVDVLVELAVDVNALAVQLGSKAWRSKGKRSAIGSGMVVARVANELPHEPAGRPDLLPQVRL